MAKPTRQHDHRNHPTVPLEVFTKWRHHKNNARIRNLEFLFTPEQWWDWWRTDDRWSRRGPGRNHFVMARKGDVGPYSPDNVYCTTRGQNCKDIPKSHRAAGMARARSEGRLRGRPGRNPSWRRRGRPVITPAGRFSSVKQAAAHHGMAAHTVRLWASTGRNGWHFEDSAPVLPGLDLILPDGINESGIVPGTRICIEPPDAEGATWAEAVAKDSG
jgi:hypothetical protein